MTEKEEEDYYCPCREVDPDHFISNEEVKWFMENKDDVTFKQDDYLFVYNCVHCNECGTAEERFLLKKKFLEDGGKIEGLDATVKSLLKHGTPFPKNKSRVQLPKGINPETKPMPKLSDTLLYLGCFTTVKTPKYAENIIIYLLKKGIQFTLLDQEICCGYPILCNGDTDTYNELVNRNRILLERKGYKKIILACPSCYMVFEKEYADLGIEFEYFTNYMAPTMQRKTGNLIIQHACPFRNGVLPKVVDRMENVYRAAGYNVLSDVPRTCCGGGIGHQLRTDIIDEIATRRMKQFIEAIRLPKYNMQLENYITTYCPDAYWIIKVFGKREDLPFELKDMCELLF